METCQNPKYQHENVQKRFSGGFVYVFAAEGQPQSVVFRAFVDALSAHEAVHGLDIGLVPLGVDILQPHGTRLVTGPALRTGGAVLFQLEQVEFIEDAQQIPHGTHETPEPLDEEAAYQQEHGQEAGKSIIDPPSAQGGGKHLVGANVAEVTAYEYESEEENDP